MTDSNRTEQDPLNQLYENRKRNIHAPGGIKRKMMYEAKQASKGNAKHWFNRIQYSAFALATLLLVGVVMVQQKQMLDIGTPMRYTSVQLHTLPGQTAQDYSHISEKYRSHVQAYEQQQAILIAHHSKQAVLRMSPQGWEMQTCDNEMVAVSSELIARLTLDKLVTPQLKSGDSVNIAFNQAGRIISITPATQPLQCS
jgi:hypothetical protein